jgi:DNA ligase N terminus
MISEMVQPTTMHKKVQQSTLRSFFSSRKPVVDSEDCKKAKKTDLTSTQEIDSPSINNNESKENVKQNENSSTIETKNYNEASLSFSSTGPRLAAVTLPSTEDSASNSINTKRVKQESNYESTRRKRRIIEDSDDEEDAITTMHRTTSEISKSELMRDFESDQTSDPGKAADTKNAPIVCSSELQRDKDNNARSPAMPSALLSSKADAKIIDCKNKIVPTKSKAKKSVKDRRMNTNNKIPDENQDANASEALGNETDILKMAIKENQVKSDKQIFDIIPDCWEISASMPYSVLCKAFSSIEQITSRLQIQEIVTTLIRQIILKDRQRHDEKSDTAVQSTTKMSDLHTVLYLASNTVAPAYECVELGIGDAILIKAIGEATGTNTNMVKQKYEVDGDLGTVAQGFKSKQRTLGGFFTAKASNSTAAPNRKSYLTATEVLTTFRKIAATKGNQSQKFKVDNIKKLLVQASDPEEIKYIIRGLQGKLRIGLAQSTVLISLAHALALTTPHEVLNRNSEFETSDFDESK